MRLKKTSYWVQMAGLSITQNATSVPGHAVVFYQPTQESNVWMYDASGSRELPTQSHELAEITTALNQWWTLGLDRKIQSIQWIDKDATQFSKADAETWLKQDRATDNQQIVSVVTGQFYRFLFWIGLLLLWCYMRKPSPSSTGVRDFVSGLVAMWLGPLGFLPKRRWLAAGIWLLTFIGAFAFGFLLPKETGSIYVMMMTNVVFIAMVIHAVKARNGKKTQILISQPDQAESRPGRIKTLLKAIASVIGTLILWIGITFSYTYFLIACLVFLTLWRGEYFSLVISGLIAIGLCIILRYVTGAIVLAGIALQGLALDDNNLEADYA